MGHSLYRIGVDVGGMHSTYDSRRCSSVLVGTNTDSVLIDITKSNNSNTRGVVASYKHITTPDVTTGIETAVQKVLETAGIMNRLGDILSLTIGTTVCHGCNAFVIVTDTNADV